MHNTPSLLFESLQFATVAAADESKESKATDDLTYSVATLIDISGYIATNGDLEMTELSVKDKDNSSSVIDDSINLLASFYNTDAIVARLTDDPADTIVVVNESAEALDVANVAARFVAAVFNLEDCSVTDDDCLTAAEDSDITDNDCVAAVNSSLELKVTNDTTDSAAAFDNSPEFAVTDGDSVMFLAVKDDFNETIADAAGT